MSKTAIEDIADLETNIAMNQRTLDALKAAGVQAFITAVEGSSLPIKDVSARPMSRVIRAWEYWKANGDTLPSK